MSEETSATLKPPQPLLVADLFPVLLQRLIALLSSLDEAQWQQPTTCDGWSVKDVALHLLGGDIGNIAYRRDGHSLWPMISGWEQLVRFINTWNEDWVRVTRRISNPMLVDMLQMAGQQMATYFQSLDPFATGGPVNWAGDDPAPVWLDVAREYTERWHHQQHIRDAVGRPGLTEPPFLAPVLAAFARAMPRAYQEVAAPAGTMVSLKLTGPGGSRWTVRRQDGHWELFEGIAADPDASFHVDADLAWRLFTKGLRKGDVEPQVTILGDQALAQHVYGMVAIIA